MENFDWQLLLTEYKLNYYTLPLTAVLSLVVFISGLAIKQKNRLVNILSIYSLASFLQLLLLHLDFIRPHLSFIDVLLSQSVSVFIIMEITCCYLLTGMLPLTRSQKRLTLLLLLAFYVFEIWHLSPIFFTRYTNDSESFVELPILIIFCCLYYYQLFTQHPYRNLKNSPVFWVMTGFTLLAFMQIPYNIVYTYLKSQKLGLQIPTIINNISYSLLFSCFWQALRLIAKTPTHA